MLTGPEIKRQVELGNIRIDPFDPRHVNPNSYDLRLSPTLLVYRTKHMPISNRSGKAVATGYETSELLWPDDGSIQDFIRFDDAVLEVLDMKKDNPTREFEIPPEGLILLPGHLYLGATIEEVEAKGFAPLIDGRSSVGRLGMEIHISAGFFDDGFRGTATLEITVKRPLRVYAGVRVCQISFHRVEGERQPYVGKYTGQKKPKASGLWKDFQPCRDSPPT
jgi:dCTP deaminase